MSESAENPSPEDVPAPAPALADLPKEPAATAQQQVGEAQATEVPAEAAVLPDEAMAEESTVGGVEHVAHVAHVAQVAQVEQVEPVESAGSADPAAPAAPPAPAVPDLSPAACAALLAERFPALFNAGRALPIKLRIQADIQQRAPGLFTKKTLSIFLHRHTTSTAYLRALVNQPQRFDLDGVAAGDVAEEHRAAATAEVERRRGIVEARRQAERDAQRQARRPAPAVAVAPAESGAPPGAAPVEDSAEAAGALPAQADDRRRPPRARREGPGPGPGPEHGHGPGPQGARPPRPARPSHTGAGPRPTGERPPRPPRPMQPRPEQPPQQDREGAAAFHVEPPHLEPHHAAAPAQGPAEAPAAAPARPAPPAAPLLSPAELEARRDRAALLRSYEASTLTHANFCVLKRIGQAELEAQLVVARQERELRPPAPRQDPRAEPQRAERGPWPNNRNERSDRGAARGPGGAPGRTSGRPPGKPSR